MRRKPSCESADSGDRLIPNLGGVLLGRLHLIGERADSVRVASGTFGIRPARSVVGVTLKTRLLVLASTAPGAISSTLSR